MKTTAFDLQLNPAHPGHKFHKLDKAKDKQFWSVRVNADIRLIVHRTESSLLLCYVGHHEDAYRWAERRKIEAHPKTGAAQLVEIRETVREVEIPHYVETEPAASPPVLAHVPNEALLEYGVPAAALAATQGKNRLHFQHHRPRFTSLRHCPVAPQGPSMMELFRGYVGISFVG